MTNDEYTAVSQRHQRNLKRSINQLGNGSIRYEYILTREQLINAYLSRMSDLGYALKIEPKRDRFVINKEVMRKAIEQATTQALKEFSQQIYVFLNNDVHDLLERNAYSILNDVFSLGSTPKKPADAGAWAEKLGATFGVAIGNAIWDIIEEDFLGKSK